jgi:hypothetical protein
MKPLDRRPRCSVSLRYFSSLSFLRLCGALLFLLLTATPPAAAAQWWKGNLHTHTLWSDGDDYPEMVVDWYKSHGYHFLVLSDHNILQEGDKWTPLTAERASVSAYDKYLDRFGPGWVQRRWLQTTQMVRLRTLNEFRGFYEQRDRFLLMLGEEISATYEKVPIHLNAVNLHRLITPARGSNILDVIQNNIDAVLEQRQQFGREVFPHINHPNFNWAITAEDLMHVRGDRFFEIYNGHRLVRNDGDSLHVSTERMWDITLAFRLAVLHLPILFGTAVDDAHHYHSTNGAVANPGRGWVVVRAFSLRPDQLVTALEDGDFYASTGVILRDLQATTNGISLQIEEQPGATYRTEFIGTRIGFDQASQTVVTTNKFPVTRRYSSEIGAVLSQVQGLSPSYQFKGDELYIRAKVISSRRKLNGYATNELEVAWTQPVVAPRSSQ